MKFKKLSDIILYMSFYTLEEYILIGNELINSILYFLAFIPIIMVPIFILQLAPFFVIKGISTLLKADKDENSAEKFFGIEPEDIESEYNERDTYVISKEERKKEFRNVKYYVIFKVIGILIVSIFIGTVISKNIFELSFLKNLGISNLSFLFIFSAISYVCVMLGLFDQFKDIKFNKAILFFFFLFDGVVNGINCGIAILFLRF